MPPNSPEQHMLDYQANEMARIEHRAHLYENKLASVKEMTNVFLVALMCFYAVWVPFLLFEVMKWPEATWTALSIACTLAIGLLMAYILSINSQHKKAVAELYMRKMGSQMGGMGMPQQQQQNGPMGWLENKTGMDLNRDGNVGNPFFQQQQPQRPMSATEQMIQLPPLPPTEPQGENDQQPTVKREK